jgi:hypothetical protein
MRRIKTRGYKIRLCNSDIWHESGIVVANVLRNKTGRNVVESRSHGGNILSQEPNLRAGHTLVREKEKTPFKTHISFL